MITAFDLLVDPDYYDLRHGYDMNRVHQLGTQDCINSALSVPAGYPYLVRAPRDEMLYLTMFPYIYGGISNELTDWLDQHAPGRWKLLYRYADATGAARRTLKETSQVQVCLVGFARQADAIAYKLRWM